MVGVLLQIAFADFVVVKYFVRLHKPAPPEPSNEEKLLTEIRDLLKDKK